MSRCRSRAALAMGASVLWPAIGGSAACGAPDARAAADPVTLPAPAAPLRLATYNVRNLFDAVPDNGGDVLDEALSTPTAAAYAAKLAALSEVIARLDADLLVLQEVEHAGALDDLAARLAPGLEYPHRRSFAGNDPRGIDLAVLSRVPIGQVVRHDEDVFRVLTARCDSPAAAASPSCWDYHFARDCLEIHLVVRGQPLVLLGVHLKAREASDSADDAKRLAEAQHTRRIADRLLGAAPDRPLVVLGDFNAWPARPERRALAGDPEICDCQGPLFTSAGGTLPEPDAHSTYSWDLEASALYDDLVLSPAAAAALVPGSAAIIHDEAISVEAAAASDHDPVAVSILVGRP